MTGPFPDATSLAQAIRSGAVDPRVVLEECFARIDAANPRLNAVVSRWPARAFAALDRLDRDAPFAGVPILIKETTPVAGERVTCASRWLADHVAAASTPLVTGLERLGFIPVGLSNAPEFGLSDVTEPALFGPCRNPWNLRHSPGGSSGGAAAAVAAGMVSIAHGSDGGGSLRAPASHCGLFTLKPSRGRPSPPMALPGAPWVPALVSHFALTRSVRDAAGLLAGIDRVMGNAPRAPARIEKPLRIAVIRVPLHGRSTHPDVARAFAGSCERLRDMGHSVEAIDWPFDGPALLSAFFVAWAGLAQGYIGYLATQSGRPIDPALLEPWTVGLLDLAAGLGAEQIMATERQLAVASTAYNALFERFDLLATPVYNGLPPLIGEHDPMQPFSEKFARITDTVAFTPIQNIAGAPAVALPSEITADRLPIGLQLAGRNGDDERLLAIAAEYERTYPWPPYADTALPELHR